MDNNNSLNLTGQTSETEPLSGTATIKPPVKKKWWQRIGFWLGLVFVLWLGLTFLIKPVLPVTLTEPANSVVDQGTGGITLPPLTDAPVISNDDPSRGLKIAPVTIVEFGDFQCPYCQESYSIIKQLLVKYPDAIRLIFRDWPVASLHSEAVAAAEAANCAYQQNKFWEYHDALFSHQAELSGSLYDSLAQSLGLDIAKFDQCRNDPATLKEIQDDMSAGLSAGVQGTPTWFVNGHKVEGALPLDIWDKLITAVLKEKLGQ